MGALARERLRQTLWKVGSLRSSQGKTSGSILFILPVIQIFAIDDDARGIESFPWQ